MAKYQIKQNDTLPSVEAELLNADNSVINLTGCTVRFLLATAPGETPKGGAAVITSALQGKVRYDWAASDTAEVGEFLGEFQITFGDGRILTVPNGSYIEIEVVSDLGA